MKTEGSPASHPSPDLFPKGSGAETAAAPTSSLSLITESMKYWTVLDV